MPSNENILGTSANLSVDQAAMDILAARQAENNAQVQAAEDVAAAPHPSENGKITWSTPGTPFLGDRYVGEPLIPNPRPTPLPITDPLPSMSYKPYDDLWAAVGNRGRVDSGYASRANDQAFLDWRQSGQPSAVANLPADSPLEPTSPRSPQYSSYAEAQQARSDILSDARNIYTARGDFNKIGSSGFNKEIVEAEASAGLREATRGGILGNIQEDMKSQYGPLQYGYGAQQLVQGATRDYAQNNSGNYLTPEQKETANAGMLPGLFTLAGTVAGAATGTPMGAWAGSIVGGGIGTGLQTVIGANEEREQSTRETAERLAASLGLAADSVASFKSQLEATGAPMQQLSQGLQTLQSTGPGVGAAAIAGAGRSALAEGEYYTADTASTSRFLSSSPALAPLSQLYRSKDELTRGQYEGIAQLALAEGNTGEFNAAMMQASRASLTGDKAYQDAASTKATVDENWWNKTGNWVGGLLTGHNIGNEAQATMDARAKALGVQNDSDSQKYVTEFADLNRSRQGLIDAGLKTTIGRAGFSVSQATGASAATLRDLVPGIDASLDAASAADQGIITTDTGIMNGLTAASDPTGSLRTSYQTLINQARADQVQNPVAKAELNRNVFQTGLQEEDAGFNLGISRSTLSGRSASSMQSGYDRQAEFLEGTAASPRSPLTPTERAGIESSVLKMRYGQAQAVYGEENAGLGILRAGRDAAISRAGILGTPEDQYAAGLGGLQSDRDQIAQNESELRRGNLTRPQILDLQRQDVQLQGDLVAAPERLRVAAYDAEGGILGNTQAGDRAGLSRAVAIGGSAAYGSVFADDRAKISLYQGAEAGSPLGSAQRARFGAQASEASAALLDDTTQSQVYRETSAERTQDVQTEGAFRRSMIAPYMDGSAEASPFTRGTAELGLLRSRLSGAERTLSSATDPLAREQDSGIVEGYKDKIAEIEQERRTGFLKALPEFIGGSPGQGNLSGILPTPGQSAFYGGNPFVTGTFGQPDRGQIHDGSPHTAHPGGAAGAFLAGSGVDNGIGALTSELKRLNDNLTRGNIGGRSAAMPSPSGYSQNNNLAVNGNGYKSGGGQ